MSALVKLNFGNVAVAFNADTILNTLVIKPLSQAFRTSSKNDKLVNFEYRRGCENLTSLRLLEIRLRTKKHLSYLNRNSSMALTPNAIFDPNSPRMVRVYLKVLLRVGP